MMTTGTMFLLMLMVPSSLVNSRYTTDSTRVLGRHIKCFEYDVMEGQVIEVRYSVINWCQNTEATINFQFVNSEKIESGIKELNRKSGGIRGTIAGNYYFCFENILTDTKYVAFEVVMKGEVVKYGNDNDDHGISQVCRGQHAISKRAKLGEPNHMLVHERSQIGVINCFGIRCNMVSLRFYNWFMETFSNIFKTCKDDQDLEVIYGKFVDLLKEFEGSVDTKDIIKIAGELAQSSTVLKEYVRVLEDSTDIKEDRRDAIEDMEYEKLPLLHDEQNIAMLVGIFTAVCFVFFWFTNLSCKQKQQVKSEDKNNRKKRWKKNQRQQNSPLNVKTPVKTEVTYSPDILDVKTQSRNTKEVKNDDIGSERNNSKNDVKNKKNQLKCCGMVKNGNILELNCSANCHYGFHLSCSQESLKAVSRKSLTGQESCLTPDCWGHVISLVCKQQNGKVFKTLKLDPVQKSVERNMKRKTQTSSTTNTSPRKNFTVFKNYVQPIVAQNADIRHLEKEAKVVKKILVSEDESRNFNKLKKRSVRNIKNIQRIHIDPIPIIQRKSKEFIKKDQILKLLKTVLIGESNFNEVIARFLDEKGLISRRNIPIIMEEVLNNLEMKQIITEENVMESMDVKKVVEEQDICAICIEILEEEVEVMECTHKYHHGCISEWMTQNPVCPVCRAHIKPTTDFPPLIRN